jgi:ketosteroid isomerase-like protein
MTDDIPTIASKLFAAIEQGDLSAPVCIVVHVSAGKIERLFEYLDPATVRGVFA